MPTPVQFDAHAALAAARPGRFAPPGDGGAA